MKKCVLEFVRRGLCACGFGPIVLAIVYLILYHQGHIQVLTVEEVCKGILSLSGLAFIAGGMNFVYHIERFPLMSAILIHGVVLYIGYLITYLINDWLKREMISFVVFSVIFVVGYLLIWAVIYIINKRKTDDLNRILKQKQEKQS